jgi:hypothetical protein
MRVSLRKMAWRTLLLGAAAGAWAALLMEVAEAVLARWGAGAAAQFAAGGLAFGLAAGLLLAPIGEFINHFLRRIGRTALLGAAAGGLAGLIGLGTIATLAELAMPGSTGGLGLAAGTAYAAAVPLALCLLAAAIGSASSLAVGNGRLAMSRARLGAIAGFVAALPAAGAALLPRHGWLLALALVFWGAVVAQALFWGERRLARRWLRVLTGPGEDDFFPLLNATVRIGKLETNDLPLRGYNEVFPMHCRMDWVDGHYKIIDDETGGLVYVNFRPVQEQSLRPGDLVKIGSALLQYGEAT